MADVVNSFTAGSSAMMSLTASKFSSIVELRMLKSITLIHAVAIETGVMIGSGIFVSPASLIHHCGSIGLTLVFWILSGIFMMLIAICYLEIGLMLPKAGGEYFYFKRTFGALMGFMFAWVAMVTFFPAFYGLLSLTAANYIFFLAFPGCEIPHSAKVCLALWIIVLIVFVNCTYVEYVAKFQIIFTVTKLLGLLLIIVIGVVQIIQGRTEILSTGFDQTNPDPSGYAVALYSGIFTYGGWQYMLVIIEETKEPEKTIPRATIISTIFVIGVYTLTNIAYFTVLTPAEMMSSPAVAMTFAEKTIGKYSVVIPPLVACSTIGALNGSILGGSRVYFAAARDNLFPKILSGISVKYLTPWPALIISGLVTVIFLMTGSVIALIEYIGFLATILFCTVMICLLYLRYKEPKTKRPFKIPIWVPIFTLVLTVGMVLLGLFNQPKKFGIGVIIILSGIPVYMLNVWKNKPRWLQNIHHKLTCVIEKILLVYPADK